MSISEFNEYYITKLNNQLMKEKNKNIILCGDFNIDLSKYDQNPDTSDFIDIMYSNSFIPHNYTNSYNTKIQDHYRQHFLQ